MNITISRGSPAARQAGAALYHPGDGHAIIGLTRCLARVRMANTGSVTVMVLRILAMNGLLALPPHSTNQMPCEQSQ
jgi:hypothetical protein